MDSYIIGFALFIICYVAARFIMSNAVKKLDDQTKLALINIFSGRSNIRLIILLITVLAFLGALRFLPEFIFNLTIIYFVTFILYQVISSFLNYKKLKEISVPANYIKSFFIATAIILFGVIALFLSVIIQFNN